MARKKKKKLVVELDLPKDDKTLKNLYIIIFFSVILGLSSGIMWVTNSGFIPTANGEPMFTNVFCGATSQDDLGNDYSAEFSGALKPSYQANESCAILQDDPDQLEWSESPWVNFVSKGKTFDVPGMPEQNKGSVIVQQPLSLDCKVDATTPTDYTVVIRDSNGEIVPGGFFEGKTGKASDVCNIEIDNIEPDTKYEIAIFSLEEGKRISSAQFDMSVDFYDGIPTNMNNKSFWLGPKIELGPLDLRPMIFLNFFGFTFFFLLYPASYYWEKVETRKNEIEAKFPDFLRDMAEYWKGGLSMTVAVQTLVKSEYGALNDEVKKMSDQLSWGIKFSDVIKQFADRVGTPLVKRAITLIAEADRAGGKISDILVTAANDSREIKFLEGERTRAIGSYIAVIWTSYFVFLGVITLLGKVFIPAIAKSNSGDEGGGDSGGANIGNMTIRSIDPLFFVTVFYYGVTMQAIGNGSMAGLMANGRFSAGFKHSGMMIIAALLAFNLLVFSPDLIGDSSHAFAQVITTSDSTYTIGLNPSGGAFVPSSI
ncbi:MAG TPA: type II secretion system F family protein [Candidatus Poseidoniales archaeon]|nr:MAG TPA: type II secretion system F family protein [Candidatus Poseidoniales archaeon]HII57923.1 type II secretion system F family protein [Candidatus Poseidoniaceae archaeon]|tara:strand:+ start:519 stop:2138 length:1620 start_codon:yes stop_codon:yes gene_type:complete